MKFFFNKLWLNTKKFWQTHRSFRKFVAVFMILYGFVALVTPILPGSWLIIFGFEILGFKILFWDKLKNFAFVASKEEKLKTKDETIETGL